MKNLLVTKKKQATSERQGKWGKDVHKGRPPGRWYPLGKCKDTDVLRPYQTVYARGTEENCRDLAAKSHYHILKLEKQKKNQKNSDIVSTKRFFT